MKTLQVFLLLMVCSLSTAISLRRLYNSRVTFAEYYTRNLNSNTDSSSSWRRKRTAWYENYRRVHAGVVVTITDGSKWLIHKDDIGATWDTVITRAGYMSSRWTREKCGNVYGHTVNDFMRAGNIDSRYSLLTSNCQHAANGMWNLVSETSCW